MTSKKIKGMISLLLSIVLVASLCLSNFSFATVSDADDYMPSGKYYIQNKQSGFYLGGFDYTSIVQTSFEPSTDWQKWELEFNNDGFYRIRNVYSGKYLTASYLSDPDISVTESSLSSSDDGQLWEFVEMAFGIDDEYREYIIISKAWAGTELALTGTDTSTMYGYPVVQDYYTYDEEYSDEWLLIPIEEACVVGINDTSGNHDHTSVLSTVDYYFSNIYYDVTTVNTTSTTAYAMKQKMMNSKVFIMRACGYYDSIGTYVYLNTSSATQILHSWDLFNYNSNTGINLSNAELVVFAGCRTAEHETQSLPKAATDAGATCAIGFHGTPPCSKLSTWTGNFAQRYTTNGENAEDAAYRAAVLSNDNDVFDYEIFG